jgi:D-glycero-alpha-D-manno-heptose-7-phosphate kinase
MIIAKTPLRVSFFGGGTDLPDFFSKHGGAVLGTSIDKYVYHSVSSFPSHLFDYSVRISYSKVECVRSTAEIEHTPFREILKDFQLDRDIEIHVAADLPSFSGLGTSSAFTVGLIKALHAFKGRHISRSELASEAIRIEQQVLKEAVGCQDQAFAAHGGLNQMRFSRSGDVVVERVSMPGHRREELSQSLMLFFTGITRRAQNIEMNKIKNMARIEGNLLKMLRHVDTACDILTGTGSMTPLGLLLNETWREKRELDPAVSNPTIDAMYEKALEAGALGGKLLGAGGGGFMLFFVPPEQRRTLRTALAGYHEIPFQIDAPGASIIHD